MATDLSAEIEEALGSSAAPLTVHEIAEKTRFPADEDAGDYKRLVELLLTAWAAYEGECPVAAKRGLEDARLLWGRKLLELLDVEG